MAILKRSKKSILGLDTQLANIEVNIANNGSNLSTEIANRTAADINIETQINTEKGRIDVLNADNTTEGSVEKKIKDVTDLKANVSDVYTKTEVDSALDTKIDHSLAISTVNVANKVATQTELNTKADSSSVYTKTEADTALNGKADVATVYTKTEIDASLSTKADDATTYTKTEVDSLVNAKADSTTVYTKTEIDTQMGSVIVDSDTVSPVTAGNKVATQTELASKANASDVYSKTEINGQMATVLVDGDTVSTVNAGNKLITQNELSTKANANDVYNKTQIDTAMGNKLDSVNGGKVGPSFKTVDETNIGNGKILSYNTVSGNLEYIENIDPTTIIDDGVTAANNTWSSNKISTELATKANTSSVYNKSEIDGMMSAAGQGIEYTVFLIADLSGISGMEQDDQALVEEDRYVYKYDTTNGWQQFYAMDASHNHDDRYYTEAEIDAMAATYALIADTYTQAQVNTLLSDKANATTVGKVGPSLKNIDETNLADGYVLSYNSTTDSLEYVEQLDTGALINDLDSNLVDTWSSSKIANMISPKADAADVYTKIEIDSTMSSVLVDGDTLSTVNAGNKVVTENELGLKANSSNVYTKGEVDTSLSSKVNNTDVLTAVNAGNKIVTESDISGFANADDVYTKANIDTQMSTKADTGVSYTKAETNTLLVGKFDTTDSVTTVNVGNKLVTETEIANFVLTSDVYTKTETDTLLDSKFDIDDSVSAVHAGNKLVTQLELDAKVSDSDVKSVVSAGNKVVTESDVTAAIVANNATLDNAPFLVVDRPTMSTKFSSGLDFVFQFALSRTPHGDTCVQDEITIYDFHENGDAATYEGVELFSDKHGEISVTLGSLDEESDYVGKTVKLTYLSTETTVPGSTPQNPIIINAGVTFESQGVGTTEYNLDFSAGDYYRVVFADGFYTDVNHDIGQTNFHQTNSTDYQAFHYNATNQLKSQAWVGQIDEVQYVLYNWIMGFANVAGLTYKLTFTRGNAVGGGGL